MEKAKYSWTKPYIDGQSTSSFLMRVIFWHFSTFFMHLEFLYCKNAIIKQKLLFILIYYPNFRFGGVSICLIIFRCVSTLSISYGDCIRYPPKDRSDAETITIDENSNISGITSNTAGSKSCFLLNFVAKLYFLSDTYYSVFKALESYIILCKQIIFDRLFFFSVYALYVIYVREWSYQ